MAVRLTHRDTEALDELLDRVSTIILDQVRLWASSAFIAAMCQVAT